MAEKVGLDSECFFIAPIGEEGSEIRKRSDGLLNYIVGDAAKTLGLTAVRADNIAEPGLITRQILDHVLGAKAAVADLTGHNANVFYEMAVRHAAKLPVVLIAEVGTPLPFDLSNMRTIFVDHKDLESAAKCRTGIVEQLSEAIENGAVDSPISASLDVQALQSGSAVERSVAELVTAVEAVGKTQVRVADMVQGLVASRPDLVLGARLWSRYIDLMRYVKHEYPTDERLNVRLDRLGLLVGNLASSRRGSPAMLDEWLSALATPTPDTILYDDVQMVGPTHRLRRVAADAEAEELPEGEPSGSVD